MKVVEREIEESTRTELRAHPREPCPGPNTFTPEGSADFLEVDMDFDGLMCHVTIYANDN